MSEILSAAPHVGCYCRVSTENQIENYSIDEQRERLMSFCKARGWKNPGMYIDPGFSGGTLDRPALNNLLTDISARRITTVVVYKLDRLSRSQKDTLWLIEDVFQKNNVDFVSVCENFDTSTPFGKAMIGILSVFAQLEKDQITERFTMGRIGRAKSGLFHGGSAIPIGYDYVDGHLVVNDYKAMQVRELFDRFERGESINSIQKSLNELYGGWNSVTAVSYALKNSIYIGKVRFKGQEYDGEHQPIVSAEQFNKTQELLKERSASLTETQKTPFRAGFVLSGLIFCGNCGAKYHGNHGYYKCYSRAKSDKKYIKDPNCKNPNMDITELDDYVKSEIRRAKFHPPVLSANSPVSDPLEDKRAALKARLSEIKQQTDRLLDLYQLSSVSAESISARIQALEAEHTQIESHLKKLPSVFVNRREEAEKKLCQCDEVFDKASTAEQRMFIAALIKKIIIDPNGAVTIEWRI